MEDETEQEMLSYFNVLTPETLQVLQQNYPGTGTISVKISSVKDLSP